MLIRGSQIFTAQMTSGEMFRRLDPEKQRLAAEKMAQMRPLFRYILLLLLAEGSGMCEVLVNINLIDAGMSWRS